MRNRTGCNHAGLRIRQAISGAVHRFCGWHFLYLMVTKVKQKLAYDDSLDAFGVHGRGGTWAPS
jgi:ammonia channel protein AmtB